MSRATGFAIVAAGAIAIVAATLFRFEPLASSPTTGPFARVWDRWSQRECVVLHVEAGGGGGIACTVPDMQALIGQKVEASKSEPLPEDGDVPTSAPGLKVYNTLLAGGFTKVEVEKWKADRSQKLASAGLDTAEIKEYWGDR